MASYGSPQPYLFPIDDSTLDSAGKLGTFPILVGVLIAVFLGIFFFPFLIVQYLMNLAVHLMDGKPFTLDPRKFYLGRNIR
jgi:hypothetical protein